MRCAKSSSSSGGGGGCQCLLCMARMERRAVRSGMGNSSSRSNLHRQDKDTSTVDAVQDVQEEVRVYQAKKDVLCLLSAADNTGRGILSVPSQHDMLADVSPEQGGQHLLGRTAAITEAYRASTVGSCNLPAGPPERWVEGVRPVGRADQHHPAPALQAVHEGQQG